MSRTDTPSTASGDLTQLGAAEIARRIAAGELTAGELVEALVRRIEQVDAALNAVVVRLFDEARRGAEQADEARRRGQPLGPLHGVPVTIKESFYVAGTPSTIGLTHRRGERAEQDGVLVQRLRRAGAIVLGKTNLSQLMFWHESDNPVYGRSNNPWDLDRTPGGSTGGEAAIIAAGGSPLGLGSDLGGSIRIPCHFCGIHGIKPTSQRLPRSGSATNLRGMEAIHFQPGPMARQVEDLQLALRVLADHRQPGDHRPPGYVPGDVTPQTLPDPARVAVEGLRIAMWTDDGYFPAAPAIRRAVHEAAQALRQRGATVEHFQPPEVPEAMGLYYAIVAADGGAGARRLADGSQLDGRLKRLMQLARMPGPLRRLAVPLLRWQGRQWQAQLLATARPRSADRYWQLSWQMRDYVHAFMGALQEGQYDALLCPPHALPALPHRKAIDLMPAASYSFLTNLLGIPAGVVSITCVRAGEESDRTPSRDPVEKLVQKVEAGSAGLPVGVQVAAPHWREDVVLAVMAAVEDAFQTRQDYPRWQGWPQ